MNRNPTLSSPLVGAPTPLHPGAAAHVSPLQRSLPARQRVLITGGAGFIGCNVAQSAVLRGHRVTLFDSLARPGVEQNLRWLRATYGSQIELIQADVRDADAVTSAVHGADIVFHFAAQVAVTTSLEDPLTDFAVNALGTLHLLEACRRASKPPLLLFTSTNKVYGELASLELLPRGDRYEPACVRTCRHGVSELTPLDFHSPYGCSKGAADRYVIDYARCFGLPAVVFRMSCIYGEHQHGNEDQGWVAHFIRQILAERPITLYGDGRQVRDLLHVGDLARAMWGALENIDVTAARAFNVGGGPLHAISLRELLQSLERIHGRKPHVEHGPWREGDQRWYVSDTHRLQQSIGWQPLVSVEDGVRRLYNWLKRRDAKAEQPAPAVGLAAAQ